VRHPPLPDQIYFLDLDQVIAIHDNLLEPGEDSRVLNQSLLEQAVASPQVGHSGGYYNSSLFDMAAALIIGLANNHPFANGNKRTAMICGNIFMAMNDYSLSIKNNRFIDVILSVVTKKMSKQSLSDFLFRKSCVCRFDSASTRIQRRSSTPQA
jgi:death-on-curing protein